MKLTEREKEVMKLLAKGRTNPSMAKTLYLSVSSVRSRLQGLYSKLDIDGSTYNRRLKLALLGQELEKEKEVTEEWIEEKAKELVEMTKYSDGQGVIYFKDISTCKDFIRSLIKEINA